MTAGIYEARPIKTRARRTNAEMSELRTAIYGLLSRENPQTVRQVFYQMTVRGYIAKTEAQYDTVCRLLTDMRRSGELPYNWLADGTRWMRKSASYGSMTDALEATARLYRRAIWDVMPDYVEVWLEKEALAGVIVSATNAWDVPLMVTRGYPSLSFLHSAGEALAANGKPTFIYYVGDWDPSGLDIYRSMEKNLRGFAGDADLTFERIAVTAAQIEEYSLPGRPTKTSDSRTKRWTGGSSVEVDAIPSAELRSIVNGAIEQHIDDDELDRLGMIEEQERATLNGLAFVHRMSEEGRA